MSTYTNMIAATALFVAGMGIAEAGSRDRCDDDTYHNSRGNALTGLYRDAASCKEAEYARREYNVQRWAATIPVYTPERHMVASDQRNNR